jgi:hypothetical protein
MIIKFENRFKYYVNFKRLRSEVKRKLEYTKQRDTKRNVWTKLDLIDVTENGQEDGC